MKRVLIAALAVLAVATGTIWLLAGRGGNGASLQLLNVSYDPTRELWREINARFVEHYKSEVGTQLDIKQSHGGSTTQARAVIDGLDADVVTLALWPDTDAIRGKGLIKDNWEKRLPHRSLPYFSTIVFVVRKGNPKGIKDWPDLIKPDVKIITPNPLTSGNGKLSFLGGWGAAVTRGQATEAARQYITQLYRQAPVLDSGARGSTVTFAERHIGDVHLTWENEAHMEVLKSKEELELVYPPVSIRAEPHVAVVDANVDRKGTRHAAESYLKFLYSPAGQEIIAKHYYRPSDEIIRKKHAEKFPDIKLFPITAVAKDWDDAQARYFADGAVFDQLYQRKK